MKKERTRKFKTQENQAFVERIKINVEESSEIWEDLKATRNKNMKKH